MHFEFCFLVFYYHYSVLTYYFCIFIHVFFLSSPTKAVCSLIASITVCCKIRIYRNFFYIKKLYRLIHFSLEIDLLIKHVFSCADFTYKYHWDLSTYCCVMEYFSYTVIRPSLKKEEKKERKNEEKWKRKKEKRNE